MAGHWRIRHKLMLGLGLVVAVLGLLLTGTLYGLNAYRVTIRTIDHRLVDLSHAFELRKSIGELEKKPRSAERELRELQERANAVREKLEKYEQAIKANHTHGLSPDKSHEQTGYISVIGKQLDELERLIHWREENPNGAAEYEDNSKQTINDLKTAADCLNEVIYKASYDHIDQANKDNRFNIWVIVITAIAGVLLLTALLRSLYQWIIVPIRDLQQGVDRVARGDFDHTIDVKSGDEIQDLAAAFDDMTARLREMYRDLARQVNERSRQLVRSERLAGVGFLAAGVAHEINNPLASIAFCSEALERRLEEVLAFRARSGGEEAEVITKYLRMIQQEAFRCKEITQRLLEFSRGGERQREPTDLGELVQSVLEVVQHLQSSRGKELSFKPMYRVLASVNAQEIKSVVLNLIVNGLDSMDDGGTLTITLGRRGGNAELVFQDTGCGMTAEVLENIFEPFFTRSRTGKGTGLGLSISHRIISQHGGEIEAVSAGPNQGSTFTVSLPLQPAEEAPRDDAEHAPRPERRAA